MKDFIKGALAVSLATPLISAVEAVLEQLSNHICTCIAVETAKKQKEV